MPICKALVVLSGGQDSTTCLFWAVREFGRERVSSLAFDYGQRHRVELDCARKVAALAGVAHAVLPIDTFAALGGNALTASSVAVPAHEAADGELPSTFVPGRNLIFLTFAAAYAYPRGITDLITGTSETDYSGYPDCRENTLEALMRAISLGMEREFALHTPLMALSKRGVVELAREVGALEAMAWTHTCYNGAQPPCGECAACRLRARGFREAGIADPLVERFRAGP